MNLKSLAERIGVTVPAVMGIRQKYALSSCTDYSEGHAILMKKLLRSQGQTAKIENNDLAVQISGSDRENRKQRFSS